MSKVFAEGIPDKPDKPHRAATLLPEWYDDPDAAWESAGGRADELLQQASERGTVVLLPGGGVRDSDEDKPRFELLRPKNVPFDEQMLTRFAVLMAKGAVKYAARNWEQFSSPEALERAYGSFWRHAEKWHAAEIDEDHAASIFANVMFVEYIKGVLDGRWEALSE